MAVPAGAGDAAIPDALPILPLRDGDVAGARGHRHQAAPARLGNVMRSSPRS